MGEELHMDKTTIINILKLSRGLSYATIFMYLLGALFALLIGAPFNVWKLILGYCIVLPGVFVGTFTNGYYDVSIDKSSTQTPVSGGSTVLADHPELLKTIRNLIVFFFSLSITLGLVFTVVFSYPLTFFAFVVVANIVAWAYTAPPLRLVYRGFGELITMIAVGFFMAGIGYFAVSGFIDLTFLTYSIPLMLTMFAFAFYVEIPDRDADLAGHKKTLVVRKNELFGFLIGSLALTGATLCFVLFYLLHLFPKSENFLVISLYSIIPLAFALSGLLKYRADPTTMIPSIFRSSVSIISILIFIDAYFVVAILI
jgi:1,4-dihydroxy-2-naphthoate octaprenyltransferase